MICFGIDPGLGRLGYGIVDQISGEMRAMDYGVICTPPEHSPAERLNEIFGALEEKIALHKPDVIAVERLFFGRNTTTAGMVWQARGVILLTAARFGIIPFEPKPSEVKLAVCGHGGADKYQVQGMVRRLLNLEADPKPDDAADALAIAITGLSMTMCGRRTNRISA
jgi:crossover junction endodeoxyribonuclease RuvC